MPTGPILCLLNWYFNSDHKHFCTFFFFFLWQHKPLKSNPLSNTSWDEAFFFFFFCIYSSSTEIPATLATTRFTYIEELAITQAWTKQPQFSATCVRNGFYIIHATLTSNLSFFFWAFFFFCSLSSAFFSLIKQRNTRLQYPYPSLPCPRDPIQLANTIQSRLQGCWSWHTQIAWNIFDTQFSTVRRLPRTILVTNGCHKSRGGHQGQL